MIEEKENNGAGEPKENISSQVRIHRPVTDQIPSPLSFVRKQTWTILFDMKDYVTEN